MNRLSVVPFLVACLGVASFTLMDAVMKDLSLAIGVYNAMLWRMPAGILMGGTIFLGLRSRWPSAAVLRLHMLRSAVATCVALAFFWGIVRVPLAEGIAITFVAPLIALYLAAIWLGEEVGSSAVLASALGIAGVVVIVADSADEIGKAKLELCAQIPDEQGNLEVATGDAWLSVTLSTVGTGPAQVAEALGGTVTKITEYCAT